MKGVKITPTTIEEVDDYEVDEDYTNRCFSGYCVDLPYRWKHRKFKLSVLQYDIFEPTDAVNPLATYFLDRW
jgi:hypothetical protein